MKRRRGGGKGKGPKIVDCLLLSSKNGLLTQINAVLMCDADYSHDCDHGCLSDAVRSISALSP